MRRKLAVVPAWLPSGSATFWAMCLLLAACFVLGGSPRGEAASLMVLRPLAILLLGFGLWRLRMSQVKAHGFLVFMALAILALPAIQLIPLPPEFWSRLPGRGLVVEIDRVAGLGPVWRPLSLTPDATRNALYAALVPFAVLVLGIQLGKEERVRLLPVVLILGGVSAFLGLIQTLGEPDGPLYFYTTTNNGSAVGLFANRNHQALLLAMMLPMLAVLAFEFGAEDGRRRLVAFACGLVLLPLILITGSRSGLILAGVALLAIPFILGRNWRAVFEVLPNRIKRNRNLPHARTAGLLLAGIGLIAISIWLGRGVAVDRLLSSISADEVRWQILPTLIAMIPSYSPVGSGMGSFVQVFRVHEPDTLLNPLNMNHAHNDWLEVLLDGGVAAALLLIIAFIGFFLQAKRAFSRRAASSPLVQYSRLGLVVVLLAALASITDYPLRVPSLASLFALAVLWAGCPLSKSEALGAAR